MDKDRLYYHFSNLGLVLIGLLSVQGIFSTVLFLMFICGTIAGFFTSWQLKNYKIHHVDTFIGMLSLAAVIIIFGRLYSMAISFENLLKLFSLALAWLTLFQSFGIRTEKSYATLQFISVCFLILSIGLALEQETLYIVMLTVFLFIFIFTMRLNLVCEKKRKGSMIIGDQQNIMSLWQQIKVGALMFSLVLIVASFVYPFVPRFENLSLQKISSTLVGLPEKVPLLKLLEQGISLKDYKEMKKEQHVDDGTKERETREESLTEEETSKTVTRFPSKEFNNKIDLFEIQSLTIQSDRDEISLDSQCKLDAELKMKDGSIIPATRIVDWKITSTIEASIDSNGNLTAKEKGSIQVSASYLGYFSNDLHIEILEPLEPIKKKGWVYYLVVYLVALFMLALLSFVTWSFIKSKKLYTIAIKDPKEFIRKIYISLCRSFRIYGISRFDYMAHREFYGSVESLISSVSAPMKLMTEGVLEARFSAHEITSEYSWKILKLFHEVIEALLQGEGQGEFWKRILFRMFLLDVSMIKEKP